ncbi:MAG: FkbM family methyltransferase [Pseudomonadota bacterium]
MLVKSIGTARRVVNSLAKMARGPKGAAPRVADVANAARSLGFLAGRKLGAGQSTTLHLGFAGQTHAFSIKDRNDLSVLEDVFLEDEYAVDVATPDVIFDLGANFGAASIAFAHKWPGAQIFAVEPNPEMFRRLTENAKPYGAITCLNVAVGAADGEADFHVTTDHVGSSFYRDGSDARSIKVQVRSLRSLMEQFNLKHVDVLKFDVEGAEELLFQDPQTLHAVGAAVGEVHPDLMAVSSDDFVSKFADFDVATAPLFGSRFLLRAMRAAA